VVALAVALPAVEPAAAVPVPADALAAAVPATDAVPVVACTPAEDDATQHAQQQVNVTVLSHAVME
jgi:hypothetical protein